MTIILFEPIRFNFLALAASMIAGLCLIVTSKALKCMNETKKNKNDHEIIILNKQVSHDHFTEAIIHLQKKYENCQTSLFEVFDGELTQLLLKKERDGQTLTIEIQNIILSCLISMNRLNDALIHLNSMTINSISNQLSYVLMLEMLLNQSDKVKENICYCISQFDKLHINDNMSFNGTNDQYSLIVKAYCLQGNEISALFYYNKIQLSFSKGRKHCVKDLFELLDNKKKYQEIYQLFNQLIASEKNDTLILNYLIKSLIKLKEQSEIIEQIYMKYKSSLSSPTIDDMLEYLSRANNEKAVLAIYSSQLTHSVNSYGIMMGLYLRKNDIETTKYYFNLLLSSKYKPTLAHCQIMIKALFQYHKPTQGISVFNTMQNEWNISPDKELYELMIKNCIENKNEFTAYELLMQSINNNIKLEKFNYEEVLDALNASDLKNRSALISSLYNVIKVSNFKRDKHLMQKLKIMTEKETSISSNDTMASSFCYQK